MPSSFLKHATGKAAVFAVTFGVVLGFQNCGYVQKSMDPVLAAGSLSSLGSGAAIPFATVQSQVINPQCLGCHSASSASGGVDLSSYSKVMAFVKAGSPSDSLIYTQISSGAMPQGGHLTSELQTLVYNWIITGANNTVAATPVPIGGSVGGSVGATPVVTATPSATATPSQVSSSPTASFSWIQANILVPKCVSCHGEMNSYSGTMQYVSAGSSSASPLYLRTQSGSMPQGGVALTTAQEAAVQSWIDLGAANNYATGSRYWFTLLVHATP